MARLEKWTGKIMVLCAVGTCLCFMGLAYLQVRVSKQATQGNDARQRQVAVYPVSLKLYEDAKGRGVISQRDLNCFKGLDGCAR